jgi:TatD DNase family protein
MTFTRALQIRRLATQLPLESLVLETDAPDIPPTWVSPGRNSPEHLPRIGETLAELRGLPAAELAEITCFNARAALPRLASIS